MAELSTVGTRVRIISRIKPRYLAGLTGEVVDRPPTHSYGENTIYVKLDVGRVRKYGPVVGCPASVLEAE